MLLVLAVGLAVAQPALAALVKLVTMPSFGDVESFEISPDGQYVVYRADQDSDGAVDLYSVPLRGGTPVRLNEALPTGSQVEWTFEFSPDGRRVIYRAPQDTTGVVELYSVPIGGPASAGVKLNGLLPPGGNVGRFGASPDGERVVYLADQQTDDVIELYSVPIEGPASAGVKINGSLVAGGDVQVFKVGPDGQYVVYRADQDTNDMSELYSVPIGGPAGDGVKLNGLLPEGDVGGFGVGPDVSPDQGRVLYLADQDTNDTRELYSVPIGGPAGAGVKLNGSMTAGGNVADYQTSPAGGRVVYRADQDTNNVVELYSVPITGSVGVKLNGLLPTGGYERYV